MFSKNKKESKEKLPKEEETIIKLKKKESPLNKIPNDILAKAIREVLKNKDS